jgi:hypothetical protein
MSKDLNARDQLQNIAQQIDEELPDGWGFMLFAFPFDDPNGRLNYVAKCQRKDAARVIANWLAKQNAEDFGKHI